MLTKQITWVDGRAITEYSFNRIEATHVAYISSPYLERVKHTIVDQNIHCSRKCQKVDRGHNDVAQRTHRISCTRRIHRHGSSSTFTFLIILQPRHCKGAMMVGCNSWNEPYTGVLGKARPHERPAPGNTP